MEIRSWLLITLVLATVALSGCSSYWSEAKKAPVGEFKGELSLIWIGEADENIGSGKFIYAPNPAKPLVFTRHKDLEYRTIQPDRFLTDGGSIPGVAKAFRGFDPWAYGPAYIIHDWLFIAARCNRAYPDRDDWKDLRGMEFADSVAIMNETIGTLMDKGRVQNNDLSRNVITYAVSTSISENLWNKSTCDLDRLDNVIVLEEPGGPIREPQTVRALTDKENAVVDALLGRPKGRVPVAEKDLENARVVATFSF